MQKWEHLILSVMFGKGETVESVTHNVAMISHEEKWSVVAE